jgi:hypothetical protein
MMPSQTKRGRRVRKDSLMRIKIEKDPAIAGIKGPLTAYLIYSNKRRPVIQ